MTSMTYGAIPTSASRDNQDSKMANSNNFKFVSIALILIGIISFFGLSDNFTPQPLLASSNNINHMKAKFNPSRYSSAANMDLITDLPGLNFDVTFNQFSGYLNISSTKHVFYWFMESQNDPSTDPVVFWTNGGPGCSGFIGLLQENGPFQVLEDLTLSENDYSWNLYANMLYVESPVSVGFSYSDDPETDYQCSDTSVADDNYDLILAFFEKFPQYKDNDFYLTSESYGGHYLPSLAKVIVEENEVVGDDSDDYINLIGFMVGNPYTDPVENIIGMFDTFWGHQLVPESVYEQWSSECKSTTDSYYDNPTCVKLENLMWTLVGDLDPYALDYPLCTTDGSSLSQRKKLFDVITRQYLDKQYNIKEDPQKYFPLKGYDACEENYMTSYLNLDSVKAALGADSSITWSECSTSIDYDYSDELTYAEQWYHFLIDGGYDLRIVILSGDDDSICATRGTQYWLSDFGLTISDSWTAWYVDEQVAGYLVQYDNNFSFTTIHGAGHEVPAFKPKQALTLFKAFLDDDIDSLTSSD